MPSLRQASQTSVALSVVSAKKATKPAHLIRGESAEEQAHQFLLDKGLTPVCRNYRCPYGELDLVMLEQGTLVIVEVRFRKTDKYGSALESITARKQARIIAATQHYLANQATDLAIRFDVIALSGDGGLEWVKNAF